MSRKDQILRNTKETLATRKERKKLATEQTQSSLNRVSRLPKGKQMREPQIGLKDETPMPSLAPPHPSYTKFCPDDPAPDGKTGTL
jgi:hypothetical protein